MLVSVRDRISSWGLGQQGAANLAHADEEGALIKAFAAQPGGDLVAALAGIAWSTGRHDIVQRVTPAA